MPQSQNSTQATVDANKFFYRAKMVEIENIVEYFNILAGFEKVNESPGLFFRYVLFLFVFCFVFISFLKKKNQNKKNFCSTPVTLSDSE